MNVREQVDFSSGSCSNKSIVIDEIFFFGLQASKGHRGPEFNDVVQGVLDRKRSSFILDEGDDRMSVSICNYVQWCRGVTNDDGSAEDGG